MGARIGSIEYYLPNVVISNDQLAKEFKDWSAEKIENKTGIRERHIVRENETALDLALKAAEKLLERYDRDKVDFVLLCTQSPDYYIPTSACILQDKLGLRTNVGAFDYNLACSGFIYGLAIAKSLIGSKIASNVLLVSSETYSKHIHPKDKANRTIFGDGASAAIIESSQDEGILEFALGTDGSGFNKLIVPKGGLRDRYDISAKEIDDGSGSIRTDNNLFMDGPGIFNFTIEAVPKVVSEVLKKNGVTLEDLDYVIFHQANKFMIEYLRRKTGIPKEKFYIGMLHTGNTVSASIPIAIKDCLNGNIISQGDRMLLVGFGAGYSWGGTIVRL